MYYVSLGQLIGGEAGIREVIRAEEKGGQGDRNREAANGNGGMGSSYK